MPPGATTGPVAVTTPSGSATSGSPFTVTAATAAPTSTEFDPAITVPGAALILSGTNFDPVVANDRVTLNEMLVLPSSITTTDVNLTVPAWGTFGRISVATPYGKAETTTDLIVVPAPYTPGDLAFTGRMAFGDANALAVPITTAGTIALVLFDDVAGHRISLKATGWASGSGSLTVTALISTGFTSSGTFVDTTLLPQAIPSQLLQQDVFGRVHVDRTAGAERDLLPSLELLRIERRAAGDEQVDLHLRRLVYEVSARAHVSTSSPSHVNIRRR